MIVRHWVVEGLNSFAEEPLKRSCIFLTHIVSIFRTPNRPFSKWGIFLEHLPFPSPSLPGFLTCPSSLSLHYTLLKKPALSIPAQGRTPSSMLPQPLCLSCSCRIITLPLRLQSLCGWCQSSRIVSKSLAVLGHWRYSLNIHWKYLWKLDLYRGDIARLNF